MGGLVRRQAWGLALVLSGALPTAQAEAQTLEVQLERTLAAQPVHFIGYESVPHQPMGGPAEKYLVLDFRFLQPRPEQPSQAHIHAICQAVLLDQNLVSTLGTDGYTRLAVAFDPDYQYDCF